MRIHLTNLLTEARAFLHAGRSEDALARASHLLEAAQQAGDIDMESEATLCLANIELRLVGRFAQAREWAQASVLGFERCRSVSGECRALATLANAAARLGHYEYAMETALLAARLAHWGSLAWEQLLAYRAVGFVAFHGRNLDEARNAYQQAILLAPRCEPPVNPFELHLGLAAIETANYATERSFMGPVPLASIADALEHHIAQCQRWMGIAHGDVSFTPGSHPTNLLMLSMATAQLAAWRGRLSEAGVAFAAMRQQLTQPWQMASVHWVEAELALAEGCSADAVAAATAMAEVAQRHQHASLTSVSLMLQSHLHHVRGDDHMALQAVHQLIRHEHSARAQSLKARLDTVDRRLEQRLQQMRLQRAETDLRLFEKLAMEDPLTGLANRRHVENTLTAYLVAGTLPLSAALIDVDRFKQVNDVHSHNVGDAVLQAIAGILTNELRGIGLAARLGGDEFVLLLPGTGLDAALQICDRIGSAIHRHPWSEIAAGLRVSLSIGAAEAKAGDTMAELLQRCDDLMYAAKASSRVDFW